MRRSNHAPGSVRHVEKRRTGTCRFADRIAQLSLAAYRSSVPQSFRDHQKQTCVATIVAHFASDGHLQVIGLGVGTKFLSEAVLHAEETNSYGTRVRDCHAEVLARRAFRRQLCLELEALSQSFENESIPESYRPILRLSCDGTDADLVDDVTLHFYSSSAPCGNATLKKFTKMERETYNDELGPNVWPEASHDPIPGHSLKLGQFALLIKKDTVAMNAVVEKPDDSLHQPHPPQNVREWPANQSDDWCPPGTSIVAFRKGSLHTCSDKICRWNYLGLQGSLLASVLKTPLYMSTIIVGRKLTACICRRAVCCRAEQFGKAAGKRQEIEIERDSEVAKYALHHPTVMGTGVYMDDVGKAKHLRKVIDHACHYNLTQMPSFVYRSHRHDRCT
jgi:double-stranded RNA-specific adenosine deaminase